MHPQHGGASPLRWLTANLTWQGAEPTGGGDDHRRRSPLEASACDSRPGEPVADRVHGPAGFDELLTDH